MLARVRGTVKVEPLVAGWDDLEEFTIDIGPVSFLVGKYEDVNHYYYFHMESTPRVFDMDTHRGFSTPYKAAELGFIDEVILPHETRIRLINAFNMLTNKVDTIPRKKHGNIPL